MLPIHTILHPTDFSGPSSVAFHMACALARDYHACLVILHVGQPPGLFYTEGVVLPPPPQEYWDELNQKLAAMETPPDVVATREVVEGAPAEEIVERARALHADLIVMGTHGRRGLKRLLMGSVAEKVMRQASCPVLTARDAIAVTTLTPEAAPAEVAVH